MFQAKAGFTREAIKQARAAKAAGDYAVGAVLVRGKILMAREVVSR